MIKSVILKKFQLIFHLLTQMILLCKSISQDSTSQANYILFCKTRCCLVISITLMLIQTMCLGDTNHQSTCLQSTQDTCIAMPTTIWLPTKTKTSSCQSSLLVMKQRLVLWERQDVGLLCSLPPFSINQ